MGKTYKCMDRRKAVKFRQIKDKRVKVYEQKHIYMAASNSNNKD